MCARARVGVLLCCRVGRGDMERSDENENEQMEIILKCADEDEQ